MRLKFLFLVGLGVGYLLGARAGRPRYEQLKSTATDAWEDPRVQRVVTETQDFIKENAPIVQKKVVSGSKAAVASAQDAVVRATELAKDVTEKSKDISGRVVEKSKDVGGRVAESSQEISGKIVSSSRHAAKNVRSRIVDRSEEVVGGVIIAAGKARDEALDVDLDDDDK